MKRKGVFVALLAIGVVCAMSMMSCQRDAQQPISITQSTGNDEPPKALGIPNKLTLDLGNKVTMKLALIPAGKFIMGSPKDQGYSDDESPQHEVKITKSFYMGIYTVTQEQYEQVMGMNPSRFEGKANPVETVSWDDAVDFCKAVSKKTGEIVRLPTEAEWEYACRAGTTTPFNIGNTIGTDDANYNGDKVYGDDKKGQYRKTTTPVGSFKPNAWGLYDMHGNVLQWCNDWYDENYCVNSPKTAPQGPKDGKPQGTHDKSRVLRGGSWDSHPVYCRSAYRLGVVPGFRGNNIGFRVVILPGSH